MYQCGSTFIRFRPLSVRTPSLEFLLQRRSRRLSERNLVRLREPYALLPVVVVVLVEFAPELVLGDGGVASSTEGSRKTLGPMPAVWWGRPSGSPVGGSKY